MAESSLLSRGQTALPCDLCGSTAIGNEVSWYCKNCEASMCCNCRKEHEEGKPLKIFKRHKVVPWEEALKSRLSEDEPCSIHSGSYYLFHCNTCHQLVCNHCILEEHNGHDFCKIEDAMETVRQDIIQYSDTIQDTLLAECVAMESTITENDKRCDDFYATKESYVQKKREKLISDVNRHCDDMLQTIAKEKMKNKNAIDQEKVVVQGKIQELKTLLDSKTETMKKSNSDMIKFRKEKPAIASIRLPAVSPLQLESLIDKQLEGLQVVQSYSTSDNSKLPHAGDNVLPYKTSPTTDYNQVKQPTTTGDNQVKQQTTTGDNQVKQPMPTDDSQVKQPTTTDDNQVKQPTTTGDNQVKQPTTTVVNQVKQPTTTVVNQVKQPMKTHDKDNNKVKQSEGSVGDVQILSRHKYDTDIQSIASVDEDKVLLCGYNSNTLMIVNTKGEILKQITTNLTVTHFTVVPSEGIITSHSGGKCLQVMSQTGQVTTSINTHPDKPSGVCLTNDRRHVAVCLYSPDMSSKLAVFGLDGRRKETFQYTDRKASDFYPQRVTTNQSGDYCVAHNGLLAVFVVSQSGTLKFTYDGSNATPQTRGLYPFDITCDKYNNLLISDLANNTIHMVDQQGKFLGYLLTPEDGVVKPKGLSLDKEGKLWLGLIDGTLFVVKYLT